MSVTVKENSREKLKENFAEVFKDLPDEILAQVINFAEFLREKELRKSKQGEPPKERIAGLNQGEIWMSDDFNDELPDEFWFGEDSRRNARED